MVLAPTSRRTTSRALAGALVAVLAVLGVNSVAVTARAADVPQTVTADVLPTVQVDGVVWAQVTVGNTVYVTGKFQNARPAGAAPGTEQVPRSNILAYDLTTGDLITSWAPSLNSDGQGITASPDGSRIYVVGNFTSVSGVNRYRIAALDARTGAVITGFNAGLNYRAKTVLALGGTVYVGGQFAIANNTARTRFAAFRATDGGLLPWAPTADDEVFSIVSPDGSRIVAGGRFTTVNGEANYGMAAVDAVTGATLPWAATTVVRNAGPNAAINNLATDGVQVYGTGYAYGSGGNLEGSFAADAVTGQVTWVTGCRGDAYSVKPIGGVVYSVGHPHNCAGIGGWPQEDPWTFQRAMATTTDARRTNTATWFNGRPAPELLNWWPALDVGTFTGQSQAAWSVTGNDRYVSLAGEFPRVNNVPQQGIVRMAVRPVAPAQAGPRYSAEMTPQLDALPNGSVRIRWRSTWDYESRDLEYRVVRDGDTAVPVRTLTAASTWWDRPSVTVVDSGVQPGTTHTYRVYAYDADGNSTNGGLATVTAAAAGGASAYSAAVLADGASSYWPLGTGSPSPDWAGGDDLALDASVTASGERAVTADPGSASAFAGTGTVPAATGTARPAPQVFSVEAWIRTTTTRGGKIIGFGTSRTGSSPGYDRHVYMRNDGRLVFGVNSGGTRVVTSAGPYNDGAWHHVVASLSGAGMVLYVDGVEVARSATTTSAQALTGYWRVGGDNLSGWPNRPTANAFAGLVDEVAVYPAALSAATVRDHFTRATTAPVNQAPQAAFTSTAQDLVVAFDASASTDPDGTVQGYAWDFGDGGTGTGSTPSHPYAAPGTYPVRLTVTDDDGATASVTRDVTVTVTDPAVVAADPFERTATGGWGSADTGGAWSVSGGAANFSVAGGTGRIQVPKAGGTSTALLTGATADDTDLRYSVAVDAAATGGGVYLTTIGRRVGAADDYRVVTRLLADGRVNLSAVRRAGGAETSLRALTVAGLTHEAGARLQVRVQVTGTAPTAVRAKVWREGTTEPAAWQVDVTDTTAALQAPGGIGLAVYLSGSSTTVPVTASYDDLLARRGQQG
ncbi:LamG-like jellyroll fold domain-containing protein [Kineococcus glutinatus]|uniref:PKD domain-containing protein n=1 Tax=Kineococcus glutinatus TaxID=1070872 RepID=A0ABP9H2P2_9ACTN